MKTISLDYYIIQKEKQKILGFEGQIKHSQSFMLGLQEALRLLPKSSDIEPIQTQPKSTFRAESDAKKAYSFLTQIAKPMGITQILEGIGKPDTKQNRASLASSLYRSARKGNEIIKVGANLFTVQGIQTESTVKPKETLDLPPDFGKKDS